jgi:hypothetical protein
MSFTDKLPPALIWELRRYSSSKLLLLQQALVIFACLTVFYMSLFGMEDNKFSEARLLYSFYNLNLFAIWGSIGLAWINAHRQAYDLNKDIFVSQFFGMGWRGLKNRFISLLPTQILLVSIVIPYMVATALLPGVTYSALLPSIAIVFCIQPIVILMAIYLTNFHSLFLNLIFTSVAVAPLILYNIEYIYILRVIFRRPYSSTLIIIVIIAKSLPFTLYLASASMSKKLTIDTPGRKLLIRIWSLTVLAELSTIPYFLYIAPAKFPHHLPGITENCFILLGFDILMNISAFILLFSIPIARDKDLKNYSL